MPALTLPRFSSLGIILSYQCPSECRHCLYACSPAWTDWVSDGDLERIVDEVARHGRLLTGLHLSGGEPFLRPDLLERAVRAVSDRRLPLDYVETNAFWCLDDAAVEASLARLKEAGLPAMLVSVSPFHSEFVPFDRVERAVRVGRRVFGPDGVVLYTAYFHDLLGTADPKYPIAFEDFLEAVGLERAALDLSDRYGLIPNGRAALDLAFLFERKPASAFFGGDCRAEITSPHHAHVDLHGNVITGLCAGLAAGNALEPGGLAAAIDPVERPLLAVLAERGVEGLMERAARGHGFREDPEGYIAKCHLCLDIRRHLARSGAVTRDLAPAGFYTNLG